MVDGAKGESDVQRTYSKIGALAVRSEMSTRCSQLANLLLLLLLAICTPTLADDVVQGRVIAVHGGDVLTLVDAQSREHKLRLAFIETPVLEQMFGEEAQTALAALVLNREVKVQILDSAGDGPQQAEVISPSGTTVNLELLNRGLAWHNYFDRQPAAERERYRAALLEAQRERRGMWALDRLEMPQDLRARQTQLLRWWLYAVALLGGFTLFAGFFAIFGNRIEAWLAKLDAQLNADGEEHQKARTAEEAAAAERDRTREIANREMDRLAAERRQRMQSAKNPHAADQSDQD